MADKEQFGERLIEACRQVNEQMKSEYPFGPADAEGWHEWKGDNMIRPAGRVDVILRDNQVQGCISAENIRWVHLSHASDIVKWRPTL